jgi:hypothetical protein
MMRRPLHALLVVAAFLSCGCASRAGDAPAVEPAMPSLKCTLVVESPAAAGQPIVARFTLTNEGTAPARVLTWLTPLEGLWGNIFRVTQDGRDVPYAGPMLKRGAPTADDYVTIPPGAAVHESVDMSPAYDLHAPGRYRIEFVDPLADRALVCNPVEVERR